MADTNTQGRSAADRAATPPALGNGMSQSQTKNYTNPNSINVDPNYPLPAMSPSYRASRSESTIRTQLYRRYYEMRDNPWRTEAEAQWQIADEEYMMWTSENQQYVTTTQQNGSVQTTVNTTTQIPDPDDTRSRLKLPDSFATIQSHLQETIDRKSRPALHATNESEEPVEDYANAVLNYNMDNTNFDYEWYMGGMGAAIRGTSFYLDRYLFEQRWVRDIDDVNPDGTFKTTKRLITDKDDDFTEWIPNEYIYIDEKARNIDMAGDMVWREILNIRDFQRKYGLKKDFKNVDAVRRGGEVSTRSIFILPRDITGNDVEVLHYFNRNLDAYWACANWVTIHDGPLPFKHKELPVATRYYYRVPGRFWGLGIPAVLRMLTAERTSIRNLNMDRQNLQINKMFLHNNMFDISEEDLVSRPHGLISVDTNGAKLDDVLKPLEYGDVPASYFKTDQIMVDDMVRATGIDVRLEAQPQTQTATEAALNQEHKLKRISMIAALDEMETIIRIGRLKWANIQFFYPLGRMDKVYQDRTEKQRTVYKTISVKGKKFDLQNINGTPTLRMQDITGASQFELNKKMAKYLEFDYNVSIAAVQFAPVSKVVRATKVTEMFSLLLGNPNTASLLGLSKAVARVLAVNDEKPEDWLSGVNQDPAQTMLAASQENDVMAAGQPLQATPGATEEHTLIHILFTKSQQYQQLVQSKPAVRQIFMQHIMGEHEANPATGPAAQAMSQNGLGGNQQGPGNPNMQATPPGQIGQLPSLPGLGLTANVPNQPQAQMAGIKSTNLSKPSRTGV